MNHPNYPSPCLNCKLPCASTGGTNYKKCVSYRTWFLCWWKYLRQIFGVEAVPPQVTKFCYHHPDELKDKALHQHKEVAAQIRTTSAKKPCLHCKQESDCNAPCDAYLRWYDESLSLIRKQVDNTSHKEEI